MMVSILRRGRCSSNPGRGGGHTHRSRTPSIVHGKPIFVAGMGKKLTTSMGRAAALFVARSVTLPRARSAPEKGGFRASRMASMPSVIVRACDGWGAFRSRKAAPSSTASPPSFAHPRIEKFFYEQKAALALGLVLISHRGAMRRAAPNMKGWGLKGEGAGPPFLCDGGTNAWRAEGPKGFCFA